MTPLTVLELDKQQGALAETALNDYFIWPIKKPSVVDGYEQAWALEQALQKAWRKAKRTPVEDDFLVLLTLVQMYMARVRQ